MNALKSPPIPDWYFTLGADTGSSVRFYITTPPNRFHRWMQKVILGINWHRIVP